MLKIIDHGNIREISLNRPPANAINYELLASFGTALDEATSEADAVVISGRPGMFSAGLDVPELIQMDREGFSRTWFGLLDMLEKIALLPIPAVFALNGHAPAGGIVLALFGDYRIMPSGNFKTGLNEVQIGLVVPLVAQQALSRLVGAHAAERMLVAGEMMSSQRALDIGLIDELADDPDEVVRSAIAWCETHVALPKAAMLQTRQMTRSGLHRIFARDNQADANKFVDGWFEESTQKTLRAMVDRLRK